MASGVDQADRVEYGERRIIRLQLPTGKVSSEQRKPHPRDRDGFLLLPIQRNPAVLF